MRALHLVAALAAFLTAPALFAPPAHADRLAEVKARGKLLAGVQDDFKPWSWRNDAGQFEGLEVELAKDLAKRLGVELQLVPVSGSARWEVLDKGQADVVIAGLGDNKRMRERADMVEPHYYGSGVAVLAARSAGLKDWPDLKDKSVCALTTTFVVRMLPARYGAKIVEQKFENDAYADLKAGRCVALAYDDSLLRATLRGDDKGWAAFEMPFEPIEVGPWGIAVAKGEATAPLGRAVGAAVADWLKSGRIRELEKTWEIRPLKLLDELRDKAGS